MVDYRYPFIPEGYYPGLPLSQTYSKHGRPSGQLPPTFPTASPRAPQPTQIAPIVPPAWHGTSIAQPQVEKSGFSLMDAIKGLYAPEGAPTSGYEGPGIPDAEMYGTVPSPYTRPPAGTAKTSRLYPGEEFGPPLPPVGAAPEDVGGPGSSGTYNLPVSGVQIPTYKPGSTPLPDWGPMPDAPVLQGPDYSKANEYFEAAKPAPYEEDPWDVKLAGLAGLASGFSPEGTVGEILGRMAGPGMRAFVGAREEEEDEKLDAERAMQAWNASMGGVTTEQAGTTANVANQNAQNVYENALAKRDALKEASQYARDEDRWQYESALNEAELGLRIAGEQRDAVYQQWQMEHPTKASDPIGDAVEEGIKRGYLPGIDMVGARADAEAEIDAMDPNLRMLDRAGFDAAVNRKLYSDFMSMLSAQQGGQ